MDTLRLGVQYQRTLYASCYIVGKDLPMTSSEYSLLLLGFRPRSCFVRFRLRVNPLTKRPPLPFLAPFSFVSILCLTDVALTRETTVHRSGLRGGGLTFWNDSIRRQRSRFNLPIILALPGEFNPLWGLGFALVPVVACWTAETRWLKPVRRAEQKR